MHKQRWGLYFFLGSLALLAAAWGCIGIFPPMGHPTLYSTGIPLAGLFFSLAAFFIGHFSYPRIQNLKVYLGGCCIGLTGLAYGLGTVFAIPQATDGFTRAMYLCVFINGIFVPLVPSFVKYQTTRQLTWAIISLEAAVLAVFWFVPALTAATGALAYHHFYDASYLFGFIWIIVVLYLCMRYIGNDFYLGGVFAGCGLLCGAGWLTGHINPHGKNYETILFCMLPVFFETGIIVHWLSRLEHRTSYDPLLHIYNREYCTRIITERSPMDTKPPFAISMIDLDHFKDVNDTYGHQAGDQVLFTLAQAIHRQVVPDGALCRYGGEELIVFFPAKTTTDVKPVMDTVRTVIEKIVIPIGKKKLSMTISCGISHRSDPGQPLKDVVAAADRALYAAKKGGRNQVKIAKAPDPAIKQQ